MYYFFNNPATTEISTLSLHDALPILAAGGHVGKPERAARVREGHVRDGVGERGGADQRARQRPLLHPLEREPRDRGVGQGRARGEDHCRALLHDVAAQVRDPREDLEVINPALFPAFGRLQADRPAVPRRPHVARDRRQDALPSDARHAPPSAPTAPPPPRPYLADLVD